MAIVGLGMDGVLSQGLIQDSLLGGGGGGGHKPCKTNMNSH